MAQQTALGLIRVVSNEELVRQEQQAERETQRATEANKWLEDTLAGEVLSLWQEARDAKQHVLPRIQRAHRARKAEYDLQKLGAIKKFGGSTEYARLTANKISIVRSWLRDVFLGQTSKPWGIRPTPKPMFNEGAQAQIEEAVSVMVAQSFAAGQPMPEPAQMRAVVSAEMNRMEQELKEEARAISQRMENHMEDQLVEAGFDTEFTSFLDNVATYPSAIMKGPVLRKKKKLTWGEGPGGPTPVVEEVVEPDFYNVDPFRVYPAAGATTPQDGYLFEHHTLSRSELYDLIGVPGYDEDAIRAVLRKAEYGGMTDWMAHTVTEQLDDVPEQQQRKVFEFDALEYSGPIQGKLLIKWGLDDADIDDPDAMYEACVWLIDQWVIKAQLNYNPLGVRPYFKTSYEEVPGEFWGNGLPDILDDVQGVVNAAVRSLVNNMGMASGPQVGINIDRLPADFDLNLLPWKTWQLNDSAYGNAGGKALEFFQPQSNATDLLMVLEKFYQLADDFSMVPRYMAGSEKVSGAGRTASGLSMLMDAANKGLKGVVANIDINVLSGLLQHLYNYNMEYAEDETIKGDAQIVAEGAVALMRIESLQLRRNEFLQITANPIDQQITGMEGRAEVLRAVAGGLELNTEKVVPPAEVLQQKEAQMAQMALLQGGTQGQAPQQATPTIGNGQALGDGSAMTDNFQPPSTG